MEINILQISVDILAVWQAGVEFSDVSGELVKIFKVQAVHWPAAGCSRFFWFCRDIKFFRRRWWLFLTPPPLSYVHVSVQAQVTWSCLAGVRLVHVLSLTAPGVVRKHAWVPLGDFQTPLWRSRAVVLGGWSHSLTQPNELRGPWFCCFVPEVSLCLLQ